jgi:hypothetical protein
MLNTMKQMFFLGLVTTTIVGLSGCTTGNRQGTGNMEEGVPVRTESGTAENTTDEGAVSSNTQVDNSERPVSTNTESGMETPEEDMERSDTTNTQSPGGAAPPDSE